ncbi:hypothetical protein AB0D67_08475 [Streptosporangium sp. NPDC048047]|uniref:hypothetical protein n=1 Tax=Streptosporangium sp. NPDC048047 TaxID=3155748 RepID=UPI00343BE073
MAAAGPHEKPVLGRDAHKAMVAGLILSGVRPVWVDPNFDPDLHLAHPPSVEAFAAAFDERAPASSPRGDRRLPATTVSNGRDARPFDISSLFRVFSPPTHSFDHSRLDQGKKCLYSPLT